MIGTKQQLLTKPTQQPHQLKLITEKNKPNMKKAGAPPSPTKPTYKQILENKASKDDTAVTVPMTVSTSDTASTFSAITSFTAATDMIALNADFPDLKPTNTEVTERSSVIKSRKDEVEIVLEKSPEKVLEQKSVEQKSVEQKSVEQKSVKQKSVKQKSVKQKSVEHKPVEQKAVEQKAVEYKPVEHKPAEHKPVEQKVLEQKQTIAPSSLHATSNIASENDATDDTNFNVTPLNENKVENDNYDNYNSNDNYDNNSSNNNSQFSEENLSINDSLKHNLSHQTKLNSIIIGTIPEEEVLITPSRFTEQSNLVAETPRGTFNVTDNNSYNTREKTNHALPLNDMDYDNHINQNETESVNVHNNYDIRSNTYSDRSSNNATFRGGEGLPLNNAYQNEGEQENYTMSLRERIVEKKNFIIFIIALIICFSVIIPITVILVQRNRSMAIPEPPVYPTIAPIGLAISGGVFPGGVVAGGIMRGFQQQSITLRGRTRPAMNGFKYIASVSGGCLTQVVYAYAPDTASDVILDVAGINHPSLITEEELNNVPERSIFGRYHVDLEPYVTDAFFRSFANEDETLWSNLVFSMFLEPFGIARLQSVIDTRYEVQSIPIFMASMLGPTELYPEYLAHLNSRFETNLDSIDRIPTKFSLESMTYRILLDNDILWETAMKSHYQIPYGVYITPDKFAVPMEKHQATFDSLAHKNATLPNKTAAAIDFDPIFVSPDEVTPEGEDMFTVKKMIGAATSFVSLQHKTIPIENLTPNTIDITTADGSQRNMIISDGGYNAVNGILALVQKKVPNIVCNLFATHNVIELMKASNNPEPWKIASTLITSYFGVVVEEFQKGGDEFDYFRAYSMHVFDLYSNNKNQIIEFTKDIKSLYDAGEPMIVTLNNLDVIHNPFWGIEGGNKVDLTVIVNIGVPRKFSEQVSEDVAPPPDGMSFTNEYGFFNNEELKNVPNMPHKGESTLTANIPELNFTYPTPLPDFKLGKKEVRMTEILSSWMIEHAWEGLNGVDGKEKFGGFKAIFKYSTA
jgi:hypothetical protein